MKKWVICGLLCVAVFSACTGNYTKVEIPLKLTQDAEENTVGHVSMAETVQEADTAQAITLAEVQGVEILPNITSQAMETTVESLEEISSKKVVLNSDWKYASFSKINTGEAVLYYATTNKKGVTIAVNAGHGTKGGSSVQTSAHPDGTAKVTGGTTRAGSTTSMAISGGMTFLNGTSEAVLTLKAALVLKDILLSRGYDVLMLRESEDVQLDNIARTVIANNVADAHISLHWDSTDTDKGVFYIGVPDVAAYRAMEPVASNWEKHEALGESLLAGLVANGVKIWNSGRLALDLTQTSYSMIPSIDIELGDRKSDTSSDTLQLLMIGLADGLDAYFKD